jgi:hypothetical protein
MRDYIRDRRKLQPITRALYTERFILKETLITTAFVNVGDINITRQTSFFLVFLRYEELTKQLHSRCWISPPPPSGRQVCVLFSVFRTTLRSVSGSWFATACFTLCFSSSKLRGLFKQTLYFRNQHTEMSGWVRPGDRGGNIKVQEIFDQLNSYLLRVTSCEPTGTIIGSHCCFCHSC